MYAISKSFDDYSKANGNPTVNLNPDKPLHPSAFTAPITRSGFVGGHKVIIIQKHSDFISIDDFYFEVFPDKYNHVKDQIMEWVDDAMKIMD